VFSYYIVLSIYKTPIHTILRAATVEVIKHQVGVSTFEKWQCEFEREYQSFLWLRCDKDEANRSLVATVKCADGLRIVFKTCRISPQPG